MQPTGQLSPNGKPLYQDANGTLWVDDTPSWWPMGVAAVATALAFGANGTPVERAGLGVLAGAALLWRIARYC